VDLAQVVQGKIMEAAQADPQSKATAVLVLQLEAQQQVLVAQKHLELMNMEHQKVKEHPQELQALVSMIKGME